MNALRSPHLVVLVLALAGFGTACRPGPRESNPTLPSVVLTPPADPEGRLVEQPTRVDVVPLLPGMRLPDDSIRVQVAPGNLQATWRPNEPATFPKLPAAVPLDLTLRGTQGKYLVDPRFTLVPGQSNTVAVLPLDPMAELPHGQNDFGAPFAEKMLFVDTTIARGTLHVSWRERYAVVSRFQIPADAEALTRLAEEQWAQNGAHRAPTDGKYDQAVVVTDEPADFAHLAPLVEALHRATRGGATPGQERVPAFQVRVALRSTVTLPVPPPPPEVSADVAKRFAGAQIKLGALSVSGRLRPAAIAPVVEARTDYFRRCYLSGLSHNPNLEGRVAARFVIGNDGKTSNVANGGSDMPDRATADCVVRVFSGLEFPEPEGGIVTVVAPMMFAPMQ